MTNQTPRQQLETALLDELNCYEIDASEVRNGATYIDSREAKQLAQQLTPAILAVIKGLPAMQEEEIDAAVEVLWNNETLSLIKHDRLIRNILRRQILAEMEPAAPTNQGQP